MVPRLLVLASCVLALAVPSAEPRLARNVILFLADAAGLPTLHAASLHRHGHGLGLFVQRMPHIALADTASASEWVTDSAAGMTAIVTGVRTHNGVIGQGPDAIRGQRDGAPLTTILELAEARGLATGAITNDSLAGATPAALYAKVNDRGKTAEIFRQALTLPVGDGVDVLIGDGRTDVAAALRQRGTTLDALAQEAGRPILGAVEAIPTDATRAVVLQDGPFDLLAAVTAARRILSRNPRGYFLMVEWDAHTDAIAAGLRHVVEIDGAVEASVAAAGPDTLVLFTADHSFDLRVHDGAVGSPLLTGTAAEDGKGAAAVTLKNVRMNDSHTGEPVLVAAQGPGSEAVQGFLRNSDLFRIMRSAFGW